MSYDRTTTVDASPGGDTVKQAILDVDTDLSLIFTYLNAHEALTATHGVNGNIVGTSDTQTLTNKTISNPTISGGSHTALTGLTVANDVDLGNFQIRAKQFYPDTPTGLAPFVIDSTTLVTNLNADQLDGQHAPSGTIVGTSDSQVLTNKTLTSPVINGGDINTPDIDGGTVDAITSLTVANDIDIGDYQLRAKQFCADVSVGTAPFVITSTTLVSNLNADLLDGQHAPSGTIVGTSDIQTLTNKTLTSPTINTPTLSSPVLDGSLSGTAFKDEDDMASNSDTVVASQQSIKAYVDAANPMSTYGHQIRCAKLHLQPGTTAGTHVTCAFEADVYQGDTDSASDVTKGGTVGNWTLDASGYTLTVDASAFTGNVVAVIGVSMDKCQVSAIHTCKAWSYSNGMKIEMWPVDSSTASDLTSILSAGKNLYVLITYVTTA